MNLMPVPCLCCHPEPATGSMAGEGSRFFRQRRIRPSAEKHRFSGPSFARPQNDKRPALVLVITKGDYLKYGSGWRTACRLPEF